MTAPLRVAVVGGGFGRSAVAPAYARHPGFDLVEVISSRDPARVAAVCARTDLDLVSVHAAPHQHRAVVDRALDAGHHVVCDKPFGANLADAEHLAARGREHAGLAVVTFEFRYESWRRAVRDLLSAGALGELESIDWVEHHASWRARTGGWQLSRAAGGGWLGAMASHTIDTLAWWAGPVGVLGACLDDDPARDVAERSCELTLSVGAGRATVVARGASSFTSGPRVLVAGSAGAVELADPAGPFRGLVPHGLAWPDGVARPAAELSFLQLVDAWCDDVARAVADGPAPNLATFADGLAWARVRHDVLTAAARTDPVTTTGR